MSVHIAEATVDPQGRIVLDHVPFVPGDKVDVVVCPHSETTRPPADLRGSVLRYDDPFSGIAVSDWESLA
jgi:hypothetical protein